MQPLGRVVASNGLAAQRRDAAVTVPVIPHAASPRSDRHVEVEVEVEVDRTDGVAAAAIDGSRRGNTKNGRE